MNWTETETIVSICTGIVALTQFFLWRYIARNKSYESEKGKNLATKEDIGTITKEIESVKDNYGKVMERYKIELQKEFEASKHTIDLCNKLDQELINHLSNCHILVDHFTSFGGIESCGKKDIQECLIPLFSFLSKYSFRYASNKIAHNIIILGDKLDYILFRQNEIEAQMMDEGEEYDTEKTYYTIVSEILSLSEKLLLELLPPFVITKPV